MATGLKNSGALNGQCRDQSDLDNTNSYSRSKCDNDWCAYLYDLYFEKDQAVPGIDCCGHRHDIEHVVVWVNGGLRLASATEPPENHHGTWQYPDLVGWDHFPAGIRDILVNADFGSASLAIKDGAFAHNLDRAKPSGIPFDPNA